jgi:crossover junction endodeoxyribonuclease RuvC
MSVSHRNHGDTAGRVSNKRTGYFREDCVRVLGVDPGLTRCGVGVVEGLPGRACTLVDYTVVRGDPDADLADRLLNLDAALTELVARHRPDAVAVERVFSQHNVRTVMGTAQASAVAILAGARAGLPVQTYTPSEVKAAVTGSGVADKAQMTAMVTRLLKLDAPPRPADAADALALAICHVWRGGIRSKLAAAAAAAAVRRGGQL